MIRLMAALALLLGLLPVGGCLESTTASLPPTRRQSGVPVPHWKYVGSFGGPARLAVGSDDPWERRYEAGRFLQLVGIDATESEVWACDLGVSRIQVFDHSGRLLRSIGAGVPLAGTLPSEIDLYTEEQNEGPTGPSRWETTPAGQRWVNDKQGLFKAFDVVRRPLGYWIADQMVSSGFGHKLRSMGCRYFGDDGSKMELQPDGGPVWPSYLAASADCVATSEARGNSVCLAKFHEGGIWEIKRPPGGPEMGADFHNVMSVERDQSSNPRYFFLKALASNAGTAVGKFDYIGGLCFYNGKLIVCDQRNRRLQVFEGRPAEGANWAGVIKVITADKYDGGQRFGVPRAVAISPDGLVYVLDAERREVAILSPGFERVGSLTAANIEAACDIALSPSGNDLFISDAGHNVIHHYAAR
jgi:hypothetical protein